LPRASASATAISEAAAQYRDELFMTQVAQGQCLRLGLEFWRGISDELVNSSYPFSPSGSALLGATSGVLFWQADDTWPAPSWSVLELGGRAKASFFDAARALAPLLLAGRLVGGGAGPGESRQLLVYFSRSSYGPLPGNASTATLVLAAHSWAAGAQAAPMRVAVALPPAHSSARIFSAPLADVLRATACPGAVECVLTLALEAGEGAAAQVLARNHVFLAPLKAVTTMRDPRLSVSRVVAAGADGRGRLAFNVSLEKGAAGVPAAAVWLETPLDGLWSDNNLLLADLDAVELVWSTYDTNATAAALADSLAVSSLFDLADYGGGGSGSAVVAASAAGVGAGAVGTHTRARRQ
jgi:beta-mannosidase